MADPASTSPVSPQTGSDQKGLSSGETGGYRRFWPLRQVVAHLDLDVLQELERFRQESLRPHPAQNRAAASPQTRLSPLKSRHEPLSLTSSVSLTSSAMSDPSSSSRPTYLEPQDVVEDLELEESLGIPRLISPVLVLLLWLGACVGIVWSIGWLITPESSQRALSPNPLDGDGSGQSPPPPLGPLPDLLGMPLIPVGSEETLSPDTQVVEYVNPRTGQRVRRILRPTFPNERVDPLDSVVNPLSSLTVARSRILPLPTPRPERRPAPQVVAAANRSRLEASYSDPLPLLSPVSVDSLDPNRGEGIFLVVMDYAGDQSLQRARVFSEGAFVTSIGGQRFVQLAAFEQVEYARYMADSLRQQGIPATVSEPL